MKKIIFSLIFAASLISFGSHAALINSNAVTGSWSIATSWAGGVVPTANDTVVIVAGANITVDNNSCIAYKCRILNTGILNCSSNTLTLAGALTSVNISGTDYYYVGNGNLSVYTGGTFNLQTGTLKMTGSLLTNGAFNCGTGTVIIDTKRAPITWSGTNSPVFHHVINNDSVPVSWPAAGGFGVTLHSTNTTFKGDVTINGSFNRNTSVNADATVTFDGTTNLSGVYSFYLNHVVINAGAAVYANNKNFNMYGNWTNNGLFDGGTGTVTFYYDPNKPFPIPTDQTITAKNGFFYNLTINKSTGTVTQIDSVVVRNNFRVSRGTWIAGLTPVRLYVAGNFTVVNIGVFDAVNGRVILNGSSVVTTQKVYTYNSTFYKFTINNTGIGVLLDTNLTVTNEVVFTNGLLYTHDGAYFNELYLSNNVPASAIGGSASSYVAGKFRRAITGTGNYMYQLGPWRGLTGVYRPVTFGLTSANGASSVLMYQDTIGNIGTYKANFYTNIIPDAGTPAANLLFAYNLSADFPASTYECAISAIQGANPPPSSWSTILPTIVGATGGVTGTITAQAPATWANNAFILGEPNPVVSNETVCEGSIAKPTILSPMGSGVFDWYDLSTGGTLLQASSISYLTPPLTVNTTYYVEHVNATTGCSTHRTSVLVTVTPLPHVNAGINDSVCNGNSYVFYTATASEYGSLNWTSMGTGSFSNNGTIAPTYTPSPADILAGLVKLILTGVGNSPCGNITDTMQLKILPNPTVNAGVDDTICEGSSFVVSTASGIGYTSLAWSSFGDGTFTGNNTLTPEYTPGPNDIIANAITLVLQTSSSCGTSSDQMILHISNAPVIQIVQDTTICSSLPYQVVNSSVSFGTTMSWTTTGDGIFTAATTENPFYQPGAGDISGGQVLLILTVQGKTPCSQKQDTTILNFTSAADILAPASDSTCATTAYTASGISAFNYSSLNWTSSGSGTFTNNGTLTPTYIPSIADTVAGSIVLTMVAAGNAPCEGDTAHILLYLIPEPHAYAGIDTTICAFTQLTLNHAAAFNYTALQWQTLGDGSFSNNTLLNPMYTPGTNDLANGMVKLILRATGSNLCGASFDTINIAITPLPMANAGVDLEICSGENISLSGNSGLYFSTVNWQTSGDGVFSFNASLHPIYYPGANDRLAGTVNLIFTVLSTCGNDNDTIVLTIHPMPNTEAGLNQMICVGSSTTLSAAGIGSYLWSTGETTQLIEVTPTATTLYYVTITNSFGCTDYDSVNVGIKPQPDISIVITPELNIYYEGQFITFKALPSGLGSYNFYIDDVLAQAGSSNIFVTNALLSGQKVTATAAVDGCMGSEEVSLVVHIIPNSFTPNNDGRNDIFIKGLDLTIINRWGQKIYSGYDGWNGQYEGKNVSPGTYFFIIRMSDLNGVISEIKGSVKLIR
ncbi:MAG: gliding motility-associated C-terminal domain-containing protein [Bacteroidota bacterium]